MNDTLRALEQGSGRARGLGAHRDGDEHPWPALPRLNEKRRRANGGE